MLLIKTIPCFVKQNVGLVQAPTPIHPNEYNTATFKNAQTIVLYRPPVRRTAGGVHADNYKTLLLSNLIEFFFIRLYSE
jgi:hypothetical protein